MKGYRRILAKKAAESTAEEIAYGRLNNDITAVIRYVEDIKSTREQITLLELLLKGVEKKITYPN